jgi:hypothetical protein
MTFGHEDKKGPQEKESCGRSPRRARRIGERHAAQGIRTASMRSDGKGSIYCAQQRGRRV